MKKLFVLMMALAILASTMFTNVAFAAAVSEEDSDSVYLWDAFYESDASRNELYDENVRYIKVDPTKANSGNNSVKMHREATHSATTLKLQKNEAGLLTGGTTYRISFYFKNNTNDETPTFKISCGKADNQYITDISEFTTESCANGWTKAWKDMLVNAYYGTFQIQLYSNHDVNIDDISVQKKQSDSTYGDNIIENSSFELVPLDLTGEVKYGSETVDAGLNVKNLGGTEGYRGFQIKKGIQSGTVSANYSTLQAAAGDYSLHIRWTADDYTTGSGNYISYLTNKSITVNSEYKVSMWVYTAGINTGLKLRCGDWTQHPIMSLAVEDASRPGWTKIEKTFTATSALPRVDIVFGGGAVDTFIDDYVVTEVADTTNADHLYGYGSFELGTIGNVVNGAMLYDSALTNEITALTDSHSEATLKAVAAVTNFTDSTLSNAQLIVAVYDGKELVDAKVSEVASVEVNDNGKMLECKITMPSFDEGSDYSVKMFIWDSIEGMFPLKGCSEINY